ncbi:TPA: hypothetical protein ACPJZ6_004620 [Vibrio diabolicus]
MAIDSLVERYIELQEEYEKYESKLCECENSLELKCRHFGNGVHYVYQCNFCGRQRGGSLKKADALSLLNGSKPREFDLSIEEVYNQKSQLKVEHRIRLWSEIRQLEAEMAGRPSYTFPSFHEIQKEKNKANEKLTDVIESIANEFSEQAVKRMLMQSVEELKKREYLENIKKTDRFTCEDELKDWLVNNLSADFDFYPEVWGVHLAEQKDIRVDYIAVPKQHLVDAGFDSSPFAVEVKYICQENGFTRKTSRAFWQTVTYNDSQFNLNGLMFKPKFSILFTNLAFVQEMELVRDYGVDAENDTMEWKGMLHLANHANVGLMHITGSKSQFRSWRIKFAGGTYFSGGFDTMGNRSLSLSNRNLVEKVRVGNF